MNEEAQYPVQQFSQDSSRVRDLEEKVRLLKDRLLLLGQTLVNEREKSLFDLREAKKAILILKEDNKKIKDLLSRMVEQISNMARKEELLILQRQFDLFREHKKEK